jgi:hypothetical protein
MIGDDTTQAWKVEYTDRWFRNQTLSHEEKMIRVALQNLDPTVCCKVTYIVEDDVVLRPSRELFDAFEQHRQLSEKSYLYSYER